MYKKGDGLYIECDLIKIGESSDVIRFFDKEVEIDKGFGLRLSSKEGKAYVFARVVRSDELNVTHSINVVCYKNIGLDEYELQVPLDENGSPACKYYNDISSEERVIA